MPLRKLTLAFWVVAATYSAAPHAEAAVLRAAWLFDDGTLEGIGPDATTGIIVDNAGTSPTFVPGVSGGTALRFSGSDHDQVVFPGTRTSLELGTDPFTIIAWISSDFTENVRFLRTQETTGAGDGWMLFHNRADASLRFNQRDEPSTFIQRDSTTDPTDSTFHMWAITRQSDGTVEIYVDGAPAEVTSPGPLVNIINTNDLTLGGNDPLLQTDPGAQLILDDIAILDGALAATEIQDIADEGLSTLGIPVSIPEPHSLLLLWSGVVGLASCSRRRRRQVGKRQTS